jgi:hypothetical protein
MLKGVVSSFLLCSLNYPNMFWLSNAIFRGLHFPFIPSTFKVINITINIISYEYNEHTRAGYCIHPMTEKISF